MPHEPPIAVGLVGFGRAAAMHFEALRDSDVAVAAAVCDASPEARARAAAADVPAFATLDAMLDAAALDAVIVCTPPDVHAAVSRACLARGLHVLCEKPLAPVARDVFQMLEDAARARRTLVVASKFRHVPELERARALLAGGALGDPVHFTISFCGAVDMRARWNAEPGRAGGGVIMDNGSHAFDMIAWLFGPIHRVSATRLRAVQPLAVEDSALLRVWAGDGVIGTVDLSWSVNALADRYLTVHGSRGTLEIGWKGARLQCEGAVPESLGGGYDRRVAHRAMHARFAAAVRERAMPWITSFECLQVAAALDAAYRSLESGIAESVALRDPRTPEFISFTRERAAAPAPPPAA